MEGIQDSRSGRGAAGARRGSPGSSAPPGGAATLLALPRRPTRAWTGAGLRRRAERWFEVAGITVVLTLAAGWTWSIAEARTVDAPPRPAPRAPDVSPAAAAVSAAFRDADRPTAAYVTDAALEALDDLRGESGKLRAVLRTPGERAEAPVEAALRAAPDLRVLTLTPLSARRRGRIGLYYIGAWPTEGRAGVPANYAPPRGLLAVTRATQDTRLSEHLRVRDFLTHDQADVWPKYVVIDPRNVDKIELVLADLAARGVPARGVHVMSGFRTPRYNQAGGDPRGRAGLSRHMYGDAADLWIDNDGDGRMDDVNRDGRVDVGDAVAVCAAVDRVERAHPELVGGCGYYPATPAHGPFTHIDARGYRARWAGSGDGG